VASADTFLLKNGGRVQGQWLNRSQTTSAGYIVRTASGVKLTLAEDDVVDRVIERPAEEEYAQLAPTFADTVAEQWRLAQWCRRRQLNRQRKTHLARILELEPENVEARRGLGYSQVDGKWVIAEDWREDNGYVYYQGRWRLPQERQLMQQQQAVEQVQRDWRNVLWRWRQALPNEKGIEIREQILGVRDTHAVPALAALYAKEPHRGVKMLYLEALGNISSPAALHALVVISLNDPDVEIFHAAVDELAEVDNPQIAQTYHRGLKDKNNVRVNRSGAALARLGNQETIDPLIESLVTTHVLVIRPPSDGSDDGVTTSFVNGPNNGICKSPPKVFTGMTAGDQTKVIPQRVPNHEVLGALVRLSGGMNFGYDQQAWRNWQEAQRKRVASKIDLRQ